MRVFDIFEFLTYFVSVIFLADMIVNDPSVNIVILLIFLMILVIGRVRSILNRS